jgi:creatinine amidohydrolase/Fe(II)-dependent formamide hydrolase-like protein
MLFKGLCDVPRIGMHMYILVQTHRGNFVIISLVKTQLIEKHKNLGIYQAHIWFILYHCCL